MIEVQWLYFVLIGIACGFVVRDRRAKILGSLVVGVIGAVPGAWLFGRSDLFPYSEFVGACAGAIVFLGIKRSFFSDSF